MKRMTRFAFAILTSCVLRLHRRFDDEGLPTMVIVIYRGSMPLIDPCSLLDTKEGSTMSGKSRVMSLRDREKFAHNGHLYTFERLDCTEKTKFWRCDKRIAQHCKARLHTSVETNEVVKEVNVHSHAPDDGRVEAAAICTSIMRQAQEAEARPEVIVKEAFQSLPFAARKKMPNKRAMWIRISRAIRKRTATGLPRAKPITRATIVVPKSYRTHKDGDGFLLYDSGLGDDDRILIFGRLSYGAWSIYMRNLVANATFDIKCPLFPHVFVLMAERGGFFIPVLFGLLPNKQESTYRHMFSALKQMWPELAPESIVVDFDRATMNALTAAFPRARVVGCFANLVRRMKMKLVEKDLLDKYNSDTEFAQSARMMMSLAFVPLDAVGRAFDEFSSESPKALRPILDWFEEDMKSNVWEMLPKFSCTKTLPCPLCVNALSGKA
ncbi:FLYWCH zinc finger domain protein [Trichuris suis]|nr:FLYWCH zinc finger domain protein [Trichuris suis]